MRSNTLDAARRAYLGLVRGTVHATDDSPKMQTIDARLLHNELIQGIERVQHYGRTSFPLPPDANGPKAAELIVGFINGNRSHPVVLAVDDRRYRPIKGKAGDVVDYHYKGNAGSWTDNGWAYAGGTAKLTASWTIGSLTVTWADGKATIQVGGGGPAVVVTNDTVFLGGDPSGGGTFDFVQTVSGPSSNVKAKL